MIYEKVLIAGSQQILDYANYCKAISLREEEISAIRFVEHGVNMLKGQSESALVRTLLQQDIVRLVQLMNDLH